MITVLIVILILMIVGVNPVWSYAGNWGYGPSGILGVVLLVVLVLLVLGRI